MDGIGRLEEMVSSIDQDHLTELHANDVDYLRFNVNLRERLQVEWFEGWLVHYER